MLRLFFEMVILYNYLEVINLTYHNYLNAFNNKSRYIKITDK